MEQRLQHVKIAILATNGFEESELLEPRAAWKREGAVVQIVSPKAGSIRSLRHKDWGKDVAVDLELSKALASEFDALHLPGGVVNPDSLRIIPRAVAFVREFIREDKPVAAICHGPWMLAEADAVRGKTVTSWISLRTDLVNAGANWVDAEVVEDGNLITSRKPADLTAFCERTIEAFSLAKASHLR
jgi:protease I